MLTLVLRSWIILVYVDVLMHLGGFNGLYERVRKQKVVRRDPMPFAKSQLSRSVDLASVFYFKRVLCLQHSASVTILLRRFGWDAQLVLGVQLLPFLSHAWTESEGHVINDTPAAIEMFSVLDRC